MSQPGITEPRAPSLLKAAHGGCPYLGLRRDRASLYALPTDEHRCYARGKAEPIPLAHQATTCLTSRAAACPRCPAVDDAGQVPVGGVATPAEPTWAADEAPAPRPAIARQWGRGLRLALGLVAVALLIVVLPVALRGLSGGPAPVAATDEPLPSISPTVAPSLAPVVSGRAAILAPWAQVTATPSTDEAGGTGAAAAPDSAPSPEGDGAAVGSQGASDAEPGPP